MWFNILLKKPTSLQHVSAKLLLLARMDDFGCPTPYDPKTPNLAQYN
jgi:hypothetical protein